MTACPTPYKQSYPTLEAAKRELNHYKATKRDNKKLINRMGAYCCPGRCPEGRYHWHLGHNKFKRQKAAL